MPRSYLQLSFALAVNMVIHKKIVVLISFLRQNFYIPKFAARKHKQKAPGLSIMRIPAFLIGRSIGI